MSEGKESFEIKETPELNAAIERDQNQSLTSPRVLIVDDSMVIGVKIQTLILEHWKDATIDVARSAEEALGYLRKVGKYDLMTLDINLPGMNGNELYEIIKEEGEEIEVLVISTEQEKSEITKMLMRGVRTYLTKPFDNQQLLDVLKPVLDP